MTRAPASTLPSPAQLRRRRGEAARRPRPAPAAGSRELGRRTADGVDIEAAFDHR